METRAPFALVGAFILVALGAAFGFVYWLHNMAGLGSQSSYQVQFNGPVPGLLVGAAVLFNGIRVGEVTNLRLAADNPRRVDATISVASGTPVRRDTKVGLDFQGLTGVPVIALEGGKELAASGAVPTLIAEPDAGQSMTQAARDALRRVDTVLTQNAQPLGDMIANLKTFSDGLAKNTGRIDGILAGLERMTGGGTSSKPKITYDLHAPRTFNIPQRRLKGQLVIAEPSAMVAFDTQRILLETSGSGEAPTFDDAQWADSIPKLLQGKLLQSFENYDIAHAPLRPMDSLSADYQLLIDIRCFQVIGEQEPAAKIGFSARIVSKDGKVIASRLFQESKALAGLDPRAAVAAFDDAFATVATDLISWTTEVL